MPQRMDKQVEAITEECMRDKRKKRKECEREAWAITMAQEKKRKKKDAK